MAGAEDNGGARRRRTRQDFFNGIDSDFRPQCSLGPACAGATVGEVGLSDGPPHGRGSGSEEGQKRAVASGRVVKKAWIAWILPPQTLKASRVTRAWSGS